MSTNEFKIRVDRDNVTGAFSSSGSPYVSAGASRLDLDQLTLQTIELMNRWLGYWELIEDSQIRRKDRLLEPGNLRVLGTHLWNLILTDRAGETNDVGRALRERIPQKGSPPLRLSIEFDDGADATLRGLPWEFLYEPVRKWFLATKTELMLTRYVATDEDRVKVSQVGAGEPLRVLLIAALPGGEMFCIHREALGALRTALTDVQNLEASDPILMWDQKMITEALNERTYHIVHVVGICRGAPGQARIFMGAEGDGDPYRDPEQFVDTLTANATRPRLIILQLCDYVDGDATENFERIAPALIRCQVPAVLALQYAAKVDQADKVGLGKDFYEALTKGASIGTAVQASREELRRQRIDRRFGTPVLYLQEDGSLLAEVTPPPRSVSGISTAEQGSAGLTIRQALVSVVQGAKGLDERQRKALYVWAAGLDPNIGVAEAKEKVRRKMLDPGPNHVVIEMFSRLGQLEKELQHAGI